MQVIDILLGAGFIPPEIERFYEALKALKGVHELQEISKAPVNEKQPIFEVFRCGGEHYTIMGWDSICELTGLKKVSLINMFSRSDGMIQRTIHGHELVSIRYKSVRKV